MILEKDNAVLANREIMGSTNPKEAKEGIDFLPLIVDYREKFAAAGRFPGGFLKREGIGPLLVRFPFSKVWRSPFLTKP